MTYLSPYPAGVTPADIDDQYDDEQEELEEPPEDFPDDDFYP
jgi:hypothetical protein